MHFGSSTRCLVLQFSHLGVGCIVHHTSWQAAREACRTRFNGDLASVRSHEQNVVGLLCDGANYGTEGEETAEQNHYKAC